MSVFPQHVRARQRGMPAQVDFHRRREPAQIVASILWNKERRFREIHLAGDVAHPGFGRRMGKDTDAGGIAGERAAGEGIHLHNANGHTSEYRGAKSLSRSWTVSLP